MKIYCFLFSKSLKFKELNISFLLGDSFSSLFRQAKFSEIQNEKIELDEIGADLYSNFLRLYLTNDNCLPRDFLIRSVEYIILLKEKEEEKDLLIFPKDGFIDIDDGFCFDKYDLKADLVSQRVIKPFKPTLHISRKALKIFLPLNKSLIKDFNFFFDPILRLAKEVVYEFFDIYSIPNGTISEAQLFYLYENIQFLEKKNRISFCDPVKISEIVHRHAVKMKKYNYKYLIDRNFLFIIFKEYLELEISLIT
ncbi:MAG: hypothetical protein O9301_13965 [Leptospira sp.]|nr:hypothetical protein [Leptospira sp.]